MNLHVDFQEVQTVTFPDSCPEREPPGLARLQRIIRSTSALAAPLTRKGSGVVDLYLDGSSAKKPPARLTLRQRCDSAYQQHLKADPHLVCDLISRFKPTSFADLVPSRRTVSD
jgi:hypothetical protein